MSSVSTMEEFVGLLSVLISPSDPDRIAGEATYNALDAAMPEQLASFLVATISGVEIPMHLRDLAVVLLRRAIIRENSIYNSISPPNQPGFRAALLAALDAETSVKLKGRIANTISDLFHEQMDVAEWPELMGYIVEVLQASDQIRKEIGLGLLGMLPQEAMNTILAGSNLASVLSIFQGALLDDTNDGRMMLQALRSLSSIFANLTRESDFDHFEGLIPTIFQGLELSINGILTGRIKNEGVDYPTFGEVSLDVAYSQMMVELADSSATFFCLKLQEFFDPFMRIVAIKDIKTDVKFVLLEFLVSLCEGAPKTVRKVKGPDGVKGYFFSNILPVCVQMMQTIEQKNFEKWGAVVDDGEEDEDEDEDDEALVTEQGESVLDRVTKALGAAGTYVPMSHQITALLADKSSWASSYVALRIIGNYMEVTARLSDKERLVAHIQEVVAVVLAYAAHPDQRVQHACFSAITGLIICHGQKMSVEQLDAVMSVVLSSVHSCAQALPRLRMQYVITLTNFIDYVESDSLEKYTGAILEQTIATLSVGPQKVQECCINAIMALSESIKGPQIAVYYDSVVPILKQLLEYSRSNKMDVLYGQTMECCAMFGEASGKEKFHTDALEMMHSMNHLDSQFGEDSAARPHLMRAWVRVARCLGTEFAPFLPYIMSYLLSAASKEVQIISRDIDEDLEGDDLEYLEDDDGWAVVRSSEVEEKSAALNLMILLAEKLQADYCPYVEQSVQVMMRNMKSLHEDVRSLAVASLQEFVKASGRALIPRESLLALSNHLVGELVQLLQKEDSPEIINTALGSLNHILVYTCADWTNQERPCDPASFTRYLTEDQIKTLLECAILKLREAIQRRAVLKAEGVVSGEPDEEDEDDQMLLLGSNEELFFNLEVLLNGIMDTHGELYMAPYEMVLRELVLGMAHTQCLAEDRSFALTIICDMVNHTIESEGCARKHYPELLPILFNEVGSNQDADKRRDCAVAIGKAFSGFPQALSSTFADALQALGQCVAVGGVEGAGSRCEATDSAVAAVGSILATVEALGHSVSNTGYVWKQWLDYLPLRCGNDMECSTTIRHLIDLLNRNHPVIADIRLTQQVLLILYNVLKEELVEDGTRTLVLEEVGRLKTERAGAIQASTSAIQICAMFGEFGC